MQQIDCLL